MPWGGGSGGVGLRRLFSSLITISFEAHLHISDLLLISQLTVVWIIGQSIL